MANESIFGHLALRFSTSPENLATEALSYILAQSHTANQAFIRFLQQIEPELPESISFQTQGVGDEGEIPDLIGMDSDGNEVMLGEAKFWAGLTDNQPVNYLRRLKKKGGKLLLFIAPETRFETLWPEVLRLSKKAKLLYAPGPEERTYRKATLADHPTLAITSWRVIINILRAAAETENEQNTLSDLQQLSGLCERMDAEAFHPLQREELACMHGKRVSHYIDLVNSAIEKLSAEGSISLEGVRATTRADGWGRYFTAQGYGCMLMFNFDLWGKKFPTPIWLSITTIVEEDGRRRWRYSAETEEKLRVFSMHEERPIFRAGKQLFIPVILPTMMEKAVVMAAIIDQFNLVFGYLSKP